MVEDWSDKAGVEYGEKMGELEMKKSVIRRQIRRINKEG